MDALELRARDLLRWAVGERDFRAYQRLGCLSVPGGGGGYAYLVYPQRPLIAYDTQSGSLLSEYCVRFRDDDAPLPDADDVLAKWMALRGREHELISTATISPPGRQVDPGHARRDIERLRRLSRDAA